MADKDLGEAIESIENLKDKEFRLFGMRMTPTTVGAAVALLGSVVGMLYGGFTLYQKVEELANLDIGEYQQQMVIMQTKVDEAIDYSRDIKNGLKDDITRIEKQVDRTEDMVRDSQEKVREMIANAEERFENKRDSLQNDYDKKAGDLRESNDRKLKDLEDRLNARLQRALDNPLAN